MVLRFSLYLKSKASFLKKKSMLGQILRKSRATPASRSIGGQLLLLNV